MIFSQKLRKIMVGLLGLGLFSCETVVEIPVPKHTPKLALRLELGNEAPDSLFYVRYPLLRPYVSRSQGILSAEDLKAVSGASLVLTDAAGKVVDSFVAQNQNDPNFMGPGYYRSVSKFAGEPGKQYSLTATAPGVETVTGKLTLPNLVSGLQATFVRTAMQPFGMEGRVNLTLSDNGSESNYYILYGNLLDAAKKPLPSRTFSELQREGEVMVELNEIHFSDRESQQLLPFDDKTFNGKTITVSREVSLYYGQQGQTARYLRLTVSSITPETYRFLKSLELYRDTNGNPFSEPSAVRGNLTNGYGYLGGFTNTTVDILLP